jgi:predicted DNA-binding protein
MSPKKVQNSKRTVIFLPPEVSNKLAAMAEDKGTTISGLIRQEMIKFVKVNGGELNDNPGHN